MCFDRNINGNKNGKILEVWLVSCVTVRATHFNFYYANHNQENVKYIKAKGYKNIFFLCEKVMQKQWDIGQQYQIKAKDYKNIFLPLGKENID